MFWHTKFVYNLLCSYQNFLDKKFHGLAHNLATQNFVVRDTIEYPLFTLKILHLKNFPS